VWSPPTRRCRAPPRACSRWHSWPPGRAIEEDAAVADRTPSGHAALPLLSAPGESGRGKGRKTARRRRRSPSARRAARRRRGDTQSSLSDAGPLETGWARAATPGPTSRPRSSTREQHAEAHAFGGTRLGIVVGQQTTHVERFHGGKVQSVEAAAVISWGERRELFGREDVD